MANPVWKKIQGIVNGYLKIGFFGPMLKKNSADNDQLDIVGNNGTSDAKVNVNTAKVKTIEVFDADNSHKTVITQTDITTDIVLKLPVTGGNEGDSLSMGPSGQMLWTGGGDAADVSCSTKTINYNTSSPDNLINMPDNYMVKNVALTVITPFDGTAPTISLGIAGDVQKFVEEADVDLTNAGAYLIDVELTEASAAQMIATIAPDGSTTGSVEIVISGVVPLPIV